MKKYYLVTCLEAENVINTLVQENEGSYSSLKTSDWSSSKFIKDDNTERLFEEVFRRGSLFLEENGNISVESIAISMPGALKNREEVIRSSRLNITHSFNLAKYFNKERFGDYHLLHDMDCIAYGENDMEQAQVNELGEIVGSTFMHIFVDEGVGSSIMIDGKIIKGAGFAGPIGRLIVEPRGTYNPQFASRGPLEMYCSRPWFSENLVNRYLTEKGKLGETEEGCRVFRNALEACAESDKFALNYAMLNEGIKNNDPIALSILNEGTTQLGLAISHIITLLNPHKIVLSGDMVTNVHSFYDRVIWSARRYSWVNAWNKTKIESSHKGRDSQIIGAAKILNTIKAN